MSLHILQVAEATARQCGLALPNHAGTHQPGKGLAKGPTDQPALLLSPQQLKQQRDKLRQYQKRVTQQLERERALARQLLRDGRKE